ncbi:MAG: Ig-like domain-containing protein [Candidatus Dormibacteria bacterium]|jgi:hypothetical protein
MVGDGQGACRGRRWWRRLLHAALPGALLLPVALGATLSQPLRVDAASGAWTVATPITDASLDAVSCDSSGCWAVGNAMTLDNGWEDVPTGQLIERGTGNGWSAVTAPATGVTGPLVSVSCDGAGDCWALGSSLIEEDSGSGWAVVPGPTLPTDGGLVSISCMATGCWAVGSVDTYAPGATDPTWQPLAAQDTGTGWSVVPTPPLPAGAIDGYLSAVSCAAFGCWAVGALSEAAGGNEGLIEEDTGSGWTIVPDPEPVTNSQLYAVSCVALDDCTAVGMSFGTPAGSAPETPLVEEDTGSGWAAVDTPAFSAQQVALREASCYDPGDCVAVGFWTEGPTDTGGSLIEEETSGAWTVDSTTNPASLDTTPMLTGVGCDGSGDCAVVGYATSGYNQAQVATVIDQNFEAASTSMTASADPASAAQGASVDLSARGLPTDATGLVTFTSGGTTLCSAQVSGGTATCDASGLDPGSYPVAAAYSGALDYQGTTATTQFAITAATPTPPATPTPTAEASLATPSVAATPAPSQPGVPISATGASEEGPGTPVPLILLATAVLLALASLTFGLRHRLPITRGR